MTSRAITRTIKEIDYKLRYDPNNDTYVDEWPYKPYERKSVQYKCGCNGYVFETKQKYNAHIKSKTHYNWVNEYSSRMKLKQDEEKEKNDLKIEVELLKRKLEKKIKKNDVLNIENDVLKIENDSLKIENKDKNEKIIKLLELHELNKSRTTSLTAG